MVLKHQRLLKTSTDFSFQNQKNVPQKFLWNNPIIPSILVLHLKIVHYAYSRQLKLKLKLKLLLGRYHVDAWLLFCWFILKPIIVS